VSCVTVSVMSHSFAERTAEDNSPKSRW